MILFTLVLDHFRKYLKEKKVDSIVQHQAHIETLCVTIIEMHTIATITKISLTFSNIQIEIDIHEKRKETHEKNGRENVSIMIGL